MQAWKKRSERERRVRSLTKQCEKRYLQTSQVDVGLNND